MNGRVAVCLPRPLSLHLTTIIPLIPVTVSGELYGPHFTDVESEAKKRQWAVELKSEPKAGLKSVPCSAHASCTGWLASVVFTLCI